MKLESICFDTKMEHGVSHYMDLCWHIARGKELKYIHSSDCDYFIDIMAGHNNKGGVGLCTVIFKVYELTDVDREQLFSQLDKHYKRTEIIDNTRSWYMS